jgi:hypothetical protein
MELMDRLSQQDEMQREAMGVDDDAIDGGIPVPGQPAVGSDPTQGKGTSAWQQALRMGLQVNARNRRN